MTPDELRERLTITVEEAAEALGIGRTAAYSACKRGELETVKLGRRLLVPTGPLLELVGRDGSVSAEADDADEQEPSPTGTSAADNGHAGSDSHSGARVVELR